MLIIDRTRFIGSHWTRLGSGLYVPNAVAAITQQSALEPSGMHTTKEGSAFSLFLCDQCPALLSGIAVGFLITPLFGGKNQTASHVDHGKQRFQYAHNLLCFLTCAISAVYIARGFNGCFLLNPSSNSQLSGISWFFFFFSI